MIEYLDTATGRRVTLLGLAEDQPKGQNRKWIVVTDHGIRMFAYDNELQPTPPKESPL